MSEQLFDFQAFRDGDQTIFERIFRENVDSIYRFILFKVSRKEDAEDLTQTVFLKAWERRGQFRGEASLKSWLFTIARNEVIDYYRTRKRTEELPEGIVGESNPHEEVGKSLEINEILRKVRSLEPKEYGEVLMHRFVNELTVEETAQAMGKTSGAVRVLQHRALQALKDQLEGNQ